MSQVAHRPHGLATLAFALLLCVSLPAQGGQEDPRKPNPGSRPAPTRITEPADPSAIRGSYTLDGQTVQVTEGDFWATYQLLKPHRETAERPLVPDQVLEHLLLFAEADAMGLAPTDAEMAMLNPAKANPTFADQMRQRWKAMGITEEQFEAYTKQDKAVARLKDWFANTVRVTSQEVFDMWKRDNFLYRVSYVAWPSDGYAEELRANPPSDADLEAFWKSSPATQQRHRRPTQISAMVLVHDPASVSEAEIDRRRAARKISRADALAFYRSNQERLDAQIPSEQRPQLYPPPGQKVPVAELVTPFSLLREQIEREMLLSEGVTTAFTDALAKADKASWETIAKENGLVLRTIDRASTEQLGRDQGDLGPQTTQQLLNATAGVNSETVRYFGTRQFVWVVTDRVDASLPELSEVRDAVLEDWIIENARKKALDAANAFMKTIEDEVDVAAKEEFAKIDTQAATNAQQNISSTGVQDERMQENIRTRYRRLAEQQKRALRLDYRPRFFSPAVEKSGMALETAGPFAFDNVQLDRRAIQGLAEQRKAFFSTAYELRGLQEGQVSRVLTDSVTDTHYVIKIESKEEPDFASMPDVEFFQKRMAVERQSTFNTNYQWTGFKARERLNWTEGK